MNDAVNVLIRTEGGQRIGFGHVRRCLSLAIALRQVGADVAFLSNPDPVVIEHIEACGFKALQLGSSADSMELVETGRRHEAKIIIVDSYSFGTDSFRALMKAGFFVAALDDLSSISLPVNLVINGSVAADELRYQALDKTRFLLGPQYMLLRSEFAESPAREIVADVGRVLITVGGSDSHNLTPQLIQWTCDAMRGVVVDVVIGPLFDNVAAIEAAAHQWGELVYLHRDPPDIRSLMLAADLAISGGGQTTYELAASGTPTIAIRLFENQTENLKGFQERAALVWVGDVDDPNCEDQVRSALSKLASDPEARRELSARGRSLIDGRGAARTAKAILSLMESS
jgi:UDP-2,4-diacetamido-2,4,6-trideoxy-beta-L-altropyranose hydrolase